MSNIPCRFLFSDKTAHEAHDLVQNDDTERDAENFQPVEDFQRNGAEHLTAELRDNDLQCKRDDKRAEHEFILDEVGENALVAQLAAVERIEQLEEHKHGKHGRGNFLRADAEEIKLHLRHADKAYKHAVDGNAYHHFPADNAFTARRGLAAHQIVADGFKPQRERGRAVHDNVDPQQIERGERRFKPFPEESEHRAEEYPPETAPSGERRVVFLSILRLMKDKGIEELLEAARQIHEKHPETVFRLLGAYEEESRARYEPLVKRLEESGALEYYGYRDDVPRFLTECHALIHPSYHEGMSNVLLEAAATARPVLASAVEGCLDTFEDGASGISFAPGNAESLARAVEAFLSLPWEKKREMGQKGRAHVEKRFDRRLVVQAYLEELKKIK